MDLGQHRCLSLGDYKHIRQYEEMLKIYYWTKKVGIRIRRVVQCHLHKLKIPVGKYQHFFFRNANASAIQLVEEQRTEGSRIVLVVQSCPAFCDPKDNIHEQRLLYSRILKARILEWVLEWVAIPFYRESPPPRDGTFWATREGLI